MGNTKCTAEISTAPPLLQRNYRTWFICVWCWWKAFNTGQLKCGNVPVKTEMKRLGCLEVILEYTVVLHWNSKAVPFAMWSLFCPYSLLRLSAVMALGLVQHLDFPKLLNRQHCSTAAKNCTTELRNKQHDYWSSKSSTHYNSLLLTLRMSH